MKTRDLLLAHCAKYPRLQVQDIFKFLHQSAFGCEHLVSSLETAVDRISAEYSEVSHEAEPLLEDLDGNFSRVHLSHLNRGLRAATLGKLFFDSARKEAEGLPYLLEKLNTVKALVQEGALPFSAAEFERAAAAWEAAGYGAIHHSDTFRETYKPAYRVISNEYIPFLPLFAALDSLLEKGKVILAVEGGSASGKSTLGQLLSSLYDCTLFHMDDFFLQPHQRTPKRYAQVGGNIDWERFLPEVLQPLRRGETVNYRRFDCTAMEVMPGVAVTPKRLTVIEGAYSMHPALRAYYDLSVFLDIAPDLQKERILKRNPPPLAKRFFEEWIPLEQRYFSGLQIPELCDIKIQITR